MGAVSVTDAHDPSKLPEETSPGVTRTRRASAPSPRGRGTWDAPGPSSAPGPHRPHYPHYVAAPAFPDSCLGDVSPPSSSSLPAVLAGRAS